MSQKANDDDFLFFIAFFIATVLARAINALAGGGGLITFPLLQF